MENIELKYNVSRETIDKLKAYEASLKEWQNKFNLVSKSSLENAWDRHFCDSVQLIKYIPETTRVMFDFGSGAGFPGMVLAVLLAEKMPKIHINLVESIKKKTLYLNAVKEMFQLNNVTIINERIENLKKTTADIITSRAMCKLTDLLGYAYPFTNKNTIMIFPKGKTFQTEIEEAKKKWKFNCQIETNETNDEGKILIINKLSPYKGVK